MSLSGSLSRAECKQRRCDSLDDESAECQKSVLQRTQQLANLQAANLHVTNVQAALDASESLLAAQYIINANSTDCATSLMNALG